MQPTKVLKMGRAYDFGALFKDERLKGFEFAAVETNMHGVRLNLVAVPDSCTPVYLEGSEGDSSRT